MKTLTLKIIIILILGSVNAQPVRVHAEISEDPSCNSLVLTTRDLSPLGNQPSTVMVIDAIEPFPPIWYYSLAQDPEDPYKNLIQDAKELNGRLSFWFSDGENSGYLRLDNEYNALDTASPTYLDPHDYQEDAAGNRLFLLKDYYIMDVSAYAGHGADTSIPVVHTAVQLVSSIGDPLWSWSSLGEIPLSESNPNLWHASGEETIDHTHPNSSKFDFDNNILISNRHTNSVIKVDRVSGSILWKYSGSNSHFYLSSIDSLKRQHDFQYIDSGEYAGRYLVFDNGSPGEASEIRIIDINDSGSSSVDAVITHPDSIHSIAMGSVQAWDQTILVNWGSGYFQPDAENFALYQQERWAAKYYLPIASFAYKVRKADHLPEIDRPEVYCNYTGDKWTLEAAGIGPFYWSNGDTGSVISVAEPGEYWVEVKKGIGWACSHAVQMVECQMAGINEIPESDLIFRSPSSQSISLELNGRKISIFDISGKLIFESNDRGKIDLHLSPGCYILRDGIQSRRIIILRG